MAQVLDILIQDGFKHAGASLARDNVRRNRLMAAGWIVVAARKRDVRNGGADVVAAVRAQLARRELA